MKIKNRDLIQSIRSSVCWIEKIWSDLPSLDRSERPKLEEELFIAVGAIMNCVFGQQYKEFLVQADGSVYAENNRRHLCEHLSSFSRNRLISNGIDPLEFKARTAVRQCSIALEKYWIEKDTISIAHCYGLDITDKAEREEALLRTAALYGEILFDILEYNFDLEKEKLH